MSMTVNGQPWGEYRPWGEGTPTQDQLNFNALRPASREAGYCLCLHPMSGVIDLTGLTCRWCGQPYTAQSSADEAKTLRADAILAAFPELAREQP